MPAPGAATGTEGVRRPRRGRRHFRGGVGWQYNSTDAESAPACRLGADFTFGRRSRVTLGADGSLCDHPGLTSNSFHCPSDGVTTQCDKDFGGGVQREMPASTRECEGGGAPCHDPRLMAIDSSRREPSPEEEDAAGVGPPRPDPSDEGIIKHYTRL